MKGKLIVIEGTDCSGKQTQSDLLVENLNNAGFKTKKFAFPNYESATGKIIGGAYLGKEGMPQALFEEGAVNVDGKVASMLFATDRLYNIDSIIKELNNGVNVVIDRYVDSNLAHQGAKIQDDKQRKQMFKFLEKLEYGLLNLPRPDVKIFLYMPTWASRKLKQNREEKPDQHEQDENYLSHAEKVYLEITKRRKYFKVDCTEGENILSVNQISDVVFSYVKNKVKK